jgi:hypothetical protein
VRRLYEWKDAKGNPVYLNNKTSSSASNTNNTSTRNFPDQTERYKKLLAQIDKEKRFNYEVITLTDNALVFNLIDPNNNNKITAIAIVYKPWTNPPVWVMTVGSGKGVDYKDWNEVLEIFEVPGIIKDISSLKESLTTLPSKLYHATYRQFLNSIKKKGLGNTKKKMWSDSKPGVVYLADDPWVAESYAEESEYIDSVEDPDDYLDNIIILEVDTSKLDTSKLYIDENVLLDADEENSTWEYHDVIPWEAIKIFDSSIAEDFEVYNTLWK